MSLVSLPVDDAIPSILETLKSQNFLVVTAAPGAGKSTRIPPALTEFGRVLLLQPRRMAARSLARRISDEQAWELGQRVGWQVRFEKRFSKATQLLVATEGILTARLREDPFLEGFSVIILDEFHERSIHADMAIALAKEAVLAREDLKLVVMSATLDAGRVASYLGDGAPCPVEEIQRRTYPVSIEYKPKLAVAGACLEALETTQGNVLVFLPGVKEIRAAARDLASSSAQVVPLYGGLSAEDQDAAIRPSSAQRIILSTNIAETSLTVDGVEVVIDSGLHRVLRFDSSIGLDRLETERISLDSADQRSGRAGRLGPGRAIRLWDPRQDLRPHREPDIARVDLASSVLDLLAWGGSLETFPWFEAPPANSLRSAVSVLIALGAIQETPLRILPRGKVLASLPLAPRLGVLLLATKGTQEGARLGALLSEGGRLQKAFALSEAPRSNSDALTMLDRFDLAPFSIRKSAQVLAKLSQRFHTPKNNGISEKEILQALLKAFPDRVAKRRRRNEARFLLCNGHGATLSQESTVQDEEYLLALDIRARQGEEALIHIASGVKKEWLDWTHQTVEHRLGPDQETVRAWQTDWYHSLPLKERSVEVDPKEAARVLAQELGLRFEKMLPPNLFARLRFADLQWDKDALLAQACYGKTKLPHFQLMDWLSFEEKATLETLAPEKLTLPSGRDVYLEYRDDGAVIAAAKLQEVFGLAETPKLGARQVPVLFSLLAPNGRSAALTDDLKNFWDNGYQAVRKELRGRYPKHPWPEDPWTALATHRTKKYLKDHGPS